MSVAKHNTTVGNPVKMWCADNVMDASPAVEFCQERGMPTPVVGEQEQEIRRFSRPAEDRHHETPKQPDQKSMEQTTCHRSIPTKP